MVPEGTREVHVTWVFCGLYGAILLDDQLYQVAYGKFSLTLPNPQAVAICFLFAGLNQRPKPIVLSGAGTDYCWLRDQSSTVQLIRRQKHRCCHGATGDLSLSLLPQMNWLEPKSCLILNETEAIRKDQWNSSLGSRMTLNCAIITSILRKFV